MRRKCNVYSKYTFFYLDNCKQNIRNWGLDFDKKKNCTLTISIQCKSIQNVSNLTWVIFALYCKVVRYRLNALEVELWPSSSSIKRGYFSTRCYRLSAVHVIKILRNLTLKLCINIKVYQITWINLNSESHQQVWPVCKDNSRKLHVGLGASPVPGTSSIPAQFWCPRCVVSPT